MSLPKPLPNCPRVRTAYMAPDGGCCSAEWVFDSPRVVELAELFHTLDEGTISTFGTPTQDESTTGIALWVRFLAFVRGSGVNVTHDGTCLHTKRESHPDVIRTFTYNDKNPIVTIDLNA